MTAVARRDWPAWWFPVPVRTSRFHAGDPAFAQFNVEVAPDRIAAFSFARSEVSDVLHYDRQTQLLGGMRGRHGSGRAGVYRGHYLKGVGRTPAAANWNDAADVYHGSGHLSVGSAIRERLITAVLESRGLGSTIVPCRAVLVGRLERTEARALQRGESSARSDFAAADADTMALTVKPADFARMSNFVFALEHFESSPQQLGGLFLDLESYLHPAGARDGLEGAPDAIARAMDQAFQRGLENFQAYARAGLHWLYLESNFTLDGRFLDLETPLYFGAPRVVVRWPDDGRVTVRDLLGFEEFGYFRHWRMFVAWLKARLHLLLARESAVDREARPFLRDLTGELTRRFSRSHLLYDDGQLADRAASNLARALALGSRDRRQLGQLAGAAFAWRVYDREGPLPAVVWRPLEMAPAPATPSPRRFGSAGFAGFDLPESGRWFADAVARMSSLRDRGELLESLVRIGRVRPNPPPAEQRYATVRASVASDAQKKA